MTLASADRIVLPASLDLAAAENLCRDLRARILAANAILVDGSQVERISTPGVQVLLAAIKGAEARGLALKLDSPSKAITEATADLGLETLFPPVRT